MVVPEPENSTGSVVLPAVLIVCAGIVLASQHARDLGWCAFIVALVAAVWFASKPKWLQDNEAQWIASFRGGAASRQAQSSENAEAEHGLRGDKHRENHKLKVLVDFQEELGDSKWPLYLATTRTMLVDDFLAALEERLRSLSGNGQLDMLDGWTCLYFDLDFGEWAVLHDDSFTELVAADRKHLKVKIVRDKVKTPLQVNQPYFHQFQTHNDNFCITFHPQKPVSNSTQRSGQGRADDHMSRRDVFEIGAAPSQCLEKWTHPH
jgi:hypothetical protein